MNMSINFNTIKDGIYNAASTVKNAVGNLLGRVVTLIKSLPEPVKVIGAFGIANGILLGVANKVSNFVYDNYLKGSNPKASWTDTKRLPADALNAAIIFGGNYALNRFVKYGFGMPVLAGVTVAGTLALRILWQVKNAPASTEKASNNSSNSSGSANNNSSTTSAQGNSSTTSAQGNSSTTSAQGNSDSASTSSSSSSVSSESGAASTTSVASAPSAGTSASAETAASSSASAAAPATT